MAKSLVSIFLGVFIGVLATLIATAILSSLSTSKPILYGYPPGFVYTQCYPNQINLQRDWEYGMILSNRAETPAYSKVCFYADNVTFRHKRIVSQGGICYGEQEIKPQSANLIQTFAPLISVNNTDDIKNITLITEITCSYKILSLISKKCPAQRYSCNYQKQGSTSKYRYIEQA